MAPAIIFGLLVLPWALLRGVGPFRGHRTLLGCVGIALLFTFTGVGHFLQPGPMAEMIPPVVPYRVPLVYVSGVIEVAAGLLVLPSWTRTAAGWFLIVMLAGLLPLNVYAAVERIPFGGHAWGPVYLLVRVPLQPVIAYRCYHFAVRGNHRERTAWVEPHKLCRALRRVPKFSASCPASQFRSSSL